MVDLAPAVIRKFKKWKRIKRLFKNENNVPDNYDFFQNNHIFFFIFRIDCCTNQFHISLYFIMHTKYKLNMAVFMENIVPPVINIQSYKPK